jgi:hypothetical protein
MKRYTIEAMVHVDIEAEDAETAYEHFGDALEEIKGCRDFSVQKVEQKEVAYFWPKGAERWAVAARNIRLGEEPYAAPVTIVGKYDGSWWWSNGHVLLRCDGEVLSGDGPSFRVLPDGEMVKAFAMKKKRRPSEWSAVYPTKRGYTRGRVACEDSGIGIDQRYYALVADTLGEGHTWHIGKPFDPMHITDREGRLMAVVMPMKPDDLILTPSEAKAS